MQIKALLDLARAIADEAGELALQDFHPGRGVATNTKGDGSLVTEADVHVERLIRDRIASACPGDAVIGEELGSAAHQGADRRWFVDPIDGTAFYARGETNWGVLLSVQTGDRVDVGILSMPALGRHWWAARGLGAYSAASLSATTDATRLEVSGTSTLERATILVEESALAGVPRAWLHDVSEARAESPLLGPGLVAEGMADAMLIGGSMPPWEVAPLLVLIEEAGGKVTDFNGVQRLDARRCVVSNRNLHRPLIAALTTNSPWHHI